MKKFRAPLRTLIPGEKGVGECPAEKNSILHGSVELKATELTVHQIDADVDIRAGGKRIIAVAGNVACGGCKINCKDALVMMTQEEKRTPLARIKRAGIDHVNPPNANILITIAERLQNRKIAESPRSGVLGRIFTSAAKSTIFSTAPNTPANPDDPNMNQIYNDIIDLNSDQILVVSPEGECALKPHNPPTETQQEPPETGPMQDFGQE